MSENNRKRITIYDANFDGETARFKDPDDISLISDDDKEILAKAFEAARPKGYTPILLIYGTGGGLDQNTQDVLKDMFYNPTSYNLGRYDKNCNRINSYFIPQYRDEIPRDIDGFKIAVFKEY